MRSLLILEIEHGEDTDGLSVLIDSIERGDTRLIAGFVDIVNHTVKVDLPECFVLETK